MSQAETPETEEHQEIGAEKEKVMTGEEEKTAQDLERRSLTSIDAIVDQVLMKGSASTEGVLAQEREMIQEEDQRKRRLKRSLR